MTTTLNTPRIQPDETLFSYVARCHWLWGDVSYKDTASDWFGYEGVCLNQLLPSHIQDISRHSEYGIDHLLHNHTAYPLHILYNARHDALKASMCGAGDMNIANLSCSPQLAFGSLTKSNYCPECAKEDVSKIGIAFWHLSHQLWGVRACYKHGSELTSVPFNPRKYRLPLYFESIQSVVPSGANTLQIEFAKHILQLLRSNTIKNAGQQHFRSLFKTRGLLTSQMHIRMPVVIERCIEVAEALCVPNVLNTRSIRRIVFDQDLSIHPLKPILLEFAVKGVREESSPPSIPAPKPLKMSETIESQAIALLQSYQFNVAEISRRLKVSHGYVKQLANRTGVKTTERKQVVTADIERQATKMAIENMSCKDIAAKLGVSEPSITGVVQSVDGLSLWRQYLRMYEKRDAVRATLNEELNRSGLINRAELKERQGNALNWAYQYDKKWLDATFPIQGNHANHSTKIWEKRDTSLFPKFKYFLKQQLETTNKLPSKYALDKAFGNHRWFTCKFDKLTKCKRMYDKLKFKINHNARRIDNVKK
ncbi:TnsD family transposase [Alteromonas lipotrueae]|uniref:TnsD family transposase n=1 Tax=Alteromonas lipotrueae TaxID=2803814 RepID=UPI00215C86B2|nr:TnsD family transposase [Alteromonas lipotrueae]